MHERRGADGLRSWALGSDKPGLAYEEERAEIAIALAPYKWYPNRAGRIDLIVSRARATGSIDDPVIAGAGRIQRTLAGWVYNHGAWPWLVALGVMVAALAFRLVGSRGSRRSSPR